MKKIRITESELIGLVRRAILNEVSQQSKAAAYVKGNKYLDDLRKRKANGERIFSKNGRMFDIDNEIQRKERQQDNFGKGLAYDLSMEYDKNKENYKNTLEIAKSDVKKLRRKIKEIKSGEVRQKYYGELDALEVSLERAEQRLKHLINDTHGYSVHSSSNGGYLIQTPNGHSYSNGSGNGMQYNDSGSSNVTRLGKLRDVTDAMSGYDDELSGRMDKNIDSLKRRQRNVQALRDYDDAYARWDQNDRKIKQSQSDYDRMSPLNPKKWFSKRPSDGPKPPIKPTWEPNENGEFDGYFSHKNPSDYNKDIDAVRDRQKKYRDAKNRYFRR